jgi:hypothetical protein
VLAAGLSRRSAPQESAYSRIAREFGARVLRQPEIAARLQAGNDAEAGRIVAQLINDGLRRLPIEDLKRRSELKQRIVEIANTSSCASIVRGAATVPNSVLEQFGKVEEGSLREWFALQERALLASVRRERALAQPADRQIMRSLEEVLSQLPVDAARRLRHGLSNLASISDEEACWAGRTLLGGVNRLPEPSRSIAVMAVATE